MIYIILIAVLVATIISIVVFTKYPSFLKKNAKIITEGVKEGLKEEEKK